MLEEVALVGVKARLLCWFRASIGCTGMLYGFRASLGFRGSFFFFFLLYTSCVLGLHSFVLSIYNITYKKLKIKKKKKKKE
jgi:hypothetical protein